MASRRVTYEQHERVSLFRQACAVKGLPMPDAEYRFAAPRRWRFDYAWPDDKLALEVDGGVWVQGRHTRGAGWLKDTEKVNEAAARGWRVLRCTPAHLGATATFTLLRRCLLGSALDDLTRATKGDWTHEEVKP